VSRFAGPILLSRDHSFEDFDCGKAPLNDFLKRYALANQSNGSARTFVGLDENRVIGYFSLAVSAVIHEEAAERMSKGLARHPIPILLMARFAVDKRYQGLGVGSGLFKDALKRCLSVSREAGVRAFMVHAKDEEARAYYARFGMDSSPGNPFHMYLLMKDVERLLSH
jgi:GNAT superfamily N-acetyltransferase